MADKFDRPDKPAAPIGPKKAAPGKPAAPANPRLEEAQRRAPSMAKAQPTSPQQFFQEAWVELKKTSWPNRDVLTKATSVVMALVVAVAIWVGGLDAALTYLTTNLPRLRAHYAPLS